MTRLLILAAIDAVWDDALAMAAEWMGADVEQVEADLVRGVEVMGSRMFEAAETYRTVYRLVEELADPFLPLRNAPLAEIQPQFMMVPIGSLVQIGIGVVRFEPDDGYESMYRPVLKAVGELMEEREAQSIAKIPNKVGSDFVLGDPAQGIRRWWG